MTTTPTALSPTSWSPSPHDQLLYQWVKLEGRSQREAASLLGVSQSTVSRVIQRYERWQAHAAERADGRLDHSERLRAQRWQTYERNEIILASCLRLAQELEGFTDVSKSTLQRSSYGGDEQHIRTQHSTLDRTGTVARFLCLAFRINMEQLKLASLAPPPPANPLSAEDLAEFEESSAAIATEFAKWSTASPQTTTAQEPLATQPSPPPTPAPDPTAASQPAPTPSTPPPPSATSPNSSPNSRPPAPPQLNHLNQMNQTESEPLTSNPATPIPCANPSCQPKKSPPQFIPPIPPAANDFAASPRSLAEPIFSS